MTFANRITIFRVALIPVFLCILYLYGPDRTWCRPLALMVYVAAALSDILDGWVARRYNQGTKFGARLDPLADKLMINLGFVFLAANPNFNPSIPMWFPVIILLRDIVIVMGAWAINEYFVPVQIKPRWTGKSTTVAQMTTLIVVLLGLSIAYPVMMITLAISIFSLADYVYEGCRQAFAREEA